MPLLHFSKDVPVGTVLEALQTQGYAIIDELAPPEVMDAITRDMQGYIDGTAYGYDNYLGKKTRRTGALIARSPASHQLVQHPLVLGTCKGLLNKASRFQLQLTQIISVYPD